MTRKEYNDLIKQEELKLKELKRERELLMNHDALKEERNQFYKRQEERYEKLSNNDKYRMQVKYAGFSEDIFCAITTGRYFASCVWKNFRKKALRKVKGYPDSAILCTKEELEKVKEIIRNLEEEMVKDMGL